MEPSSTTRILSFEEQQQRNEQRKDAKCFGHSEAEDQSAELAISSGRIAQRASEIAAEDVAKADTGTAHSKGCDAGTDVSSGRMIHNFSSFLGLIVALLPDRVGFQEICGNPSGIPEH